jgi:hypothetical protein
MWTTVNRLSELTNRLRHRQRDTDRQLARFDAVLEEMREECRRRRCRCHEEGGEANPIVIADEDRGELVESPPSLSPVSYSSGSLASCSSNPLL